jgi:hypothetical protein
MPVFVAFSVLAAVQLDNQASFAANVSTTSILPVRARAAVIAHARRAFGRCPATR